MPLSNEDPSRQVVPRWRTFASANTFKEVNPLSRRAADAFNDGMLKDIVEDWVNQRGLSVAADLVSAAFAIGRRSVALEAAKQVISQGESIPAAQMIARKYLFAETVSGVGTPESDLEIAGAELLHRRIASTRGALIDYPFDAVGWANLSLFFTTIGQRRKAVRAMLVALGLAPHNRFIVRSACRFFLHEGDFEHAHHVLLAANTIKTDPWIIAAEIAVAERRKRTSRNMKRARQMIESQNYSPFDLSELAGGLATVEAMSASYKAATKLCALSLQQPAENAIAQAAWLDRQVMRVPNSAVLLRSTASSEAAAWAAREEGSWNKAFEFSIRWLAEQPFSTRPAVFASYAASTGLEDYQQASEVLEFSLMSNPNDSTLRNNLAFAQAKLGQIDKALNSINAADRFAETPSQVTCATATRGLIAFRSNEAELGRKYYGTAIETATRAELPDYACIAKAYLAIEEARIKSDSAATLIHEALELVEDLPVSIRETFRSKLTRAKSSLQSPPL